MEYFINEFPEILNEPWRSFPYEWHVGRREFESQEMRNWLDNNVEWRETEASQEKVFLFSSEEDAMAFKLMFL